MRSAAIGLGISLVACTFEPPGGEASTASIGDGGTADDGDGTATGAADDDGPTGGADGSEADAGSGASDDATSGDTTNDGDGCPLGTEGCACDARTCGPGLVCADDVCAATECGNRRVEPGEDCDDGNAMVGDGCEPDCTWSVGAAQVVAGLEHTCARTFSGEVYCWGQGANGRLGYGDTILVGDDELPFEVGAVPLGGAAVELAAGGDFTCAILQGGGVRCWGRGANGRLGNLGTDDIGDDEAASASALVDIGGPAVAVAAGSNHACALRDDGGVLCWGSGNGGRLGYGNTAAIGDDETPASVGLVVLPDAAEQLTLGGGHTCARIVGGVVYCWGVGTGGRLGLGDADSVGDDETPSDAGPVPLGELAQGIAAGGEHTCARLAEGALRCWGAGDVGQLGNGLTDDLGDAPDEIPAVLADVPLGGDAIALGLGIDHSCAVVAGGTAMCWGEGNHGRLGQNALDDLLSPPANPIDLSATLRVLEVAAGGAHTCARLQDGTLRCFGRNNRGQLGYGNTTNVGAGGGTPTAAEAGPVPFIP